ncbi:MAG: chemotaxis protein CheW, partial [bacterium]|nr:chemotaxis protein CheW [bacterium]
KLPKEKIIVIRYNDNLIGLLIDDVRKLVEFENEQIIKVKHSFGLPQNFFEGKIVIDGKEIFILDIYNLLAFEGELKFQKDSAVKEEVSREVSKIKKKKSPSSTKGKEKS